MTAVPDLEPPGLYKSLVTGTCTCVPSQYVPVAVHVMIIIMIMYTSDDDNVI